MAWTEQQETAINARNTSLIVSAAAGSGKTAVLTERLVQLIADPASGVRADRIVVVTFTNDAASELKNRLDDRLRGMINERPSDRHLLKQQTLFQNAKISTINAFCFELLRDNIGDQGITSGFSVLDEADHSVLMAQAMDELIGWYTENDYETISYLYDKFCIKDEQQLIGVISSLDRSLSSVAFRDRWLELAVKEYEKPLSETVYLRRFIEESLKKLRNAAAVAADCLSMIPMIFPDTESEKSTGRKSLEAARDDISRIDDAISALSAGRMPDEAEAGELSSFVKLPTVRANVVHDRDLREIYKKKRKLAVTAVKSVIESFRTLESDHEESGRVTAALAGVVKKYQQILWELKCEKNAISFDDGERLTLELLATVGEDGSIVRTETAERLSEYYDTIMIDEYQDSNNKEDMIFRLLSKEPFNGESGRMMYGSDVFLVGDVKQSIYGFRLANPKNFADTLSDAQPYPTGGGETVQSVFLNRNFRSSPEVIDFVNHLFSQIMSRECGDIDYNADEMLYFGATAYSEEGGEKRKTHISIINDDNDEADESLPKQLRTKENKEAAYTARRIADMLSSGAEVTCKDGTVRRCRPSDFGVLVRTNAFINVYADELRKLGVPVKGKEESGYLRSREIAVLIDLLRVIDNPTLDISMIAVMTSPMYMFTIQEAALIRSLSGGMTVYGTLCAIYDGTVDCGDMFLAQRCRELVDSLRSFRLCSVTMTVGELITSIYDMTDFISVMQLRSDGEKKRANLRALIQYARNYEESAASEGSGGLGGFLRHIDRVIKKGDYSQGKVSIASGDYVTVQTLHASKGLEYPFVFICETSCGFQFDSFSVMFSPDNMVGYILYSPEYVRKYKTFQQTVLTGEKKRVTRSEEMRLLYVGMTRAKQQLFINLKSGKKALDRLSGHISSYVLHNGRTDEIISEASEFSDWLWAMLIRHASFPEIAAKLGAVPEKYDIPPASDYDDVFTYEIVENVAENEFSEIDEPAPAEPDLALTEELKEIVRRSYDKTLAQTPARLSVTQVTRKLSESGEGLDFELKRPRFISESKKLTGSERGTAIHTFFQYCDFSAAMASPSDEVQRIAGMGYLTPAHADSIDTRNVSAFFGSDIYRRIAAADKVWREKKFMVAVSELGLDDEISESFRNSGGMIKGIVDLMFEENGRLILVDYKSDRGTSADELRDRYSIQLRLYRAAIELTSQMKVSEAYLYSFELRRAIPIEL